MTRNIPFTVGHMQWLLPSLTGMRRTRTIAMGAEKMRTVLALLIHFGRLSASVNSLDDAKYVLRRPDQTVRWHRTMATREPQHDHNVLRISRDAFNVASCTLQVNATEDQPLVFACLAPLCQSPRQLDDPRGGEVTGRRPAEVCWGSSSCTCQQETSGGSSFLPHIQLYR